MDPSTQISRSAESPEAPESEAVFPTGETISNNLHSVAFFPATQTAFATLPLASDAHAFVYRQRPMESMMSTVIRQASNAIVIAASLYKEFAVSASDLLRPSRYLNR